MAWDRERSLREENSGVLIIDAAAKTWHRRCPVCEGERMVVLPSIGYLDPPDAIDCPICEGVGRVDQARYDRGWDLLNSELADPADF